VRDLAGPGAVAPHAADLRACEADREVAARVGGDAHRRRRTEALHRGAHGGLDAIVGHAAREDLGVLVGDHQQSRAAGQDLRQLGRVEQALDGAVDHQCRGRERGGDRRESCDGVGRAGRADGNGDCSGRRRHDDAEDAGAELAGSQLREFDQDGARLRLGQDRDKVAWLDRAAAQDRDEGGDPAGLDAFNEHRAVHRRGVK